MHHSSTPRVSVIVVNFNGMKWLEGCFASLFQTRYPNFEVILVDNGSSDGSCDWVRQNQPGVRIIENGANLGFGQANEIGMKASDTELVAFLNNDTRVEEDWLGYLVETLTEHQDVAIACSKLFLMGHPELLNARGGGMNYLGYGFDQSMFEQDSVEDELVPCLFPTAAACLVRRAHFDAVGGFDPRFFMYHEDVDLGWRLWLSGCRVLCDTRSRVRHAFGGTTLKVSSMAFRNRLGQRHALRSLLKNYQWSGLFRVLPRFLYLGVRQAWAQRSMSFVWVLAWNARYLADTLRQRRRIQQTRRVADEQLASLIWQHVALPVYPPDYEIFSPALAADRALSSQLIVTQPAVQGLGPGWYGVEPCFADAAVPVRWTRRTARVYLHSPCENPLLSLEWMGLDGLPAGARQMEVLVDGISRVILDVRQQGWVTRSVALQDALGPIEIELRCDQVWQPHDTHDNGDFRHLGVPLKRIALTDPATIPDRIDGISVIIPTYNRSADLQRTLQALAKQSLERANYQIVLVDDGSSDDTRACVDAFIAENRDMDVCYLWQPNQRQGAARNLGFRHVNRPLVLFLGDDITPDATFLEEHLGYHQRHNVDGRLIALGYTGWPRSWPVTPFMHYVNEYGWQFGYSIIPDARNLPCPFFYTSNVSLARRQLERLDKVFDEAFDGYGWEDVDLGYRLIGNGLVMHYHPAARAEHYHPTKITSFIERQLRVGHSARALLDLRPDLQFLVGDVEKTMRWMPGQSLLRHGARVLDWIDRRLRVRLPYRVYKYLLDAFYLIGFREKA